MRENLEVLVKGIGGTSASVASTWISLMPQIEAYLRITSLLIGIAVGIITFVSIYRTIRKK